MRDPFRPNTNKQLVREAQFGFTVIGLLIAVLIYVAYYRIHGPGDSSVAMQANSNPATIEAASDPPQPATAYRQPQQQLSAAPKRMFEQSETALRKVGSAANSINSTVSKVQSLASVPVQPSATEVGNPAIEKPSLTFPAIAKASNDEMLTAPSGEKRIWIKGERYAQLLDKGISTKNAMPPGVIVEPQPFPTSKHKSPNLLENKLKSHEASNDFKPLGAKTNPAMPKEIKPEDFSRISMPRLPGNTHRVSPNSIASKQPTAKPFESNTQKMASVEKAELDQSASNLIPQSGNPHDFRRPPVSAANTAIRDTNETPQQDVAKPKIQTVAFQRTTWVVKKGDSFWSIAKSHYGDGRFFRALYEVNKKNVPGFEDLVVGVELDLPTKDALVNSYPHYCPADAVFTNDTESTNIDQLTQECDAKLKQCFYVTKSGDTLFSVATKRLGQASRYVELLELNRFRLAEHVTQETELPTGIRLLLPKK